MNWYYADAGQQKGPVSDMEFTTLIRDGRVGAETLVWKEGQPDWQPLGKVRPDLLEAPPAAPAFAPPVMGARTLPGQEKYLYVQQVREGALTPGGAGQQGGFRYAGFWIRVAAKLIDGLILMVPMIGVYILCLGGTGMLTGQIDPNDSEAQTRAAIGFVAYLVIAFTMQILYNTLMVWSKGGTLGKLAVGIKVVQASGEPLSFGRSLGRAAADLINSVVCNGLPYIMVAFDEPEKRALQDHICATRVIYKAK